MDPRRVERTQHRLRIAQDVAQLVLLHHAADVRAELHAPEQVEGVADRRQPAEAPLVAIVPDVGVEVAAQVEGGDAPVPAPRQIRVADPHAHALEEVGGRGGRVGHRHAELVVAQQVGEAQQPAAGVAELRIVGQPGGREVQPPAQAVGHRRGERRGTRRRGRVTVPRRGQPRRHRLLSRPQREVVEAVAPLLVDGAQEAVPQPGGILHRAEAGRLPDVLLAFGQVDVPGALPIGDVEVARAVRSPGGLPVDPGPLRQAFDRSAGQIEAVEIAMRTRRREAAVGTEEAARAVGVPARIAVVVVVAREAPHAPARVLGAGIAREQEQIAPSAGRDAREEHAAVRGDARRLQLHQRVGAEARQRLAAGGVEEAQLVARPPLHGERHEPGAAARPAAHERDRLRRRLAPALQPHGEVRLPPRAAGEARAGEGHASRRGLQVDEARVAQRRRAHLETPAAQHRASPLGRGQAARDRGVVATPQAVAPVAVQGLEIQSQLELEQPLEVGAAPPRLQQSAHGGRGVVAVEVGQHRLTHLVHEIGALDAPELVERRQRALDDALPQQHLPLGVGRPHAVELRQSLDEPERRVLVGELVPFGHHARELLQHHRVDHLVPDHVLELVQVPRGRHHHAAADEIREPAHRLGDQAGNDVRLAEVVLRAVEHERHRPLEREPEDALQLHRRAVGEDERLARQPLLLRVEEQLHLLAARDEPLPRRVDHLVLAEEILRPRGQRPAQQRREGQQEREPA